MSEIKNKQKREALLALVGVVLLVGFVYIFQTDSAAVIQRSGQISTTESLDQQVRPKEGVTLPIEWDDLGVQMVEVGVIERAKFESLYDGRGGLTDGERDVLYGTDNTSITLNRENSGMLLNMFWAFGLSNKNEILDRGPMVHEKYGGDPSRFASTAGWSLSVGNPMNHYSKHKFISLSDEEQAKVESVSKGIFRPCCGNSTHFPDCNHGMAMLGLLELLAKQGLSEDEMFEMALKVNSYWFPDTYVTLAKYFEQKGTPWSEVDARVVLGAEYSSSRGYKAILQKLQPANLSNQGGCGV